jgi:hypothetical protein
MGAPGGYFGRFGGSSSDDDNMVVGTSDSSIQQMGINAVWSTGSPPRARPSAPKSLA